MNGAMHPPQRRADIPVRGNSRSNSSRPELLRPLRTGMSARLGRPGCPSVAQVWRGLLLLGISLGIAQHTWAADTNAPISISLSDQWEKSAVLHAPLERITILAVADRAGAEQINEWVAPLKVQFGTNVHFFAVADVGAVPGPLRGMVRRRFAKEYSYPIGLDWKGTITGQLTLTSKAVNLFVLDRAGTIQHTTRGAVETEALRKLIGVVTRLLPTATQSEAGERLTTRASAP